MKGALDSTPQNSLQAPLQTWKTPIDLQSPAWALPAPSLVNTPSKLIFSSLHDFYSVCVLFTVKKINVFTCPCPHSTSPVDGQKSLDLYLRT